MEGAAPPVASSVKEGFSASLSGACLPDLVQMACLSRMDGAFRVISQGRIGYLFFREGQIVHAVIDDLEGLGAALELLKWNRGSFEPSNMSWPNEPSIDMGFQYLLMQAARETDEARRHQLRSAPASAENSPKAKELSTVQPPKTPISNSLPKPVAGPVSQSPPAMGPRPVPVASPPRAAPSTNAPPPAPSLMEALRGAGSSASAVSPPALPASAPASGASVRVDPQGTIVSGRGASEELAEIGAYAARLAQLIGESFGMDGFSALESIHEEHRRLIHVDQSGGMVALTAPPQADVASIRQKFGL